MKWEPAIALLGVAAACGSTTASVPSGQLRGPSGMTAVTAGDRDVVFVANSGGDGLVAFQLCTKTLDGGAPDPTDTCTPQEDGQYVPGPIRVLAGTIETGNRTARVAGARLTQGAPDGGVIQNGEAFTVGADQSVRVVDARALVNAQERQGTAAPATLPPVNIGAVGVDIVAANALDAPANPAQTDLTKTDFEIGSPSVRVFAATIPGSGANASLVAMTAQLDANGNAQLPTINGRCDLGVVQPRRIAVAPGKSAPTDFVYVADGGGDGVVKVPISGISGGACPLTRISAGGRAVAALALSPPWYETTTAGQLPARHDSGEIVMMALQPLPGAQPGRDVDPGGVLFARTSDGAILPVPPFDYREPGHPPMQPLIPLRGNGTSLAREVTFLRSLSCPAAPCTPLYLGSASGSATGLESFDLLAAVSAADGATSFINVPRRRFVTPAAFTLGQVPTALTPTAVATGLQPGQSDPNAAVLTTDTTMSVPGVARPSNWQVIWHAEVPGLDRSAGTLTRIGPGALRFSTTQPNLALWVNDPVFKLGAGDVAAIATASSADPACTDLVAAFNASSVLGPESTITAINAAAGTIDLQQQTTGPALSDVCSAIQATLSIRAAGNNPWTIFQDATPVGRWHTGEPYLARQQRYDYPLDACAITPAGIPCYQPNDPLVTSDIAFAFTITGRDPAPFSSFSIQVTVAPARNIAAPSPAGLPAGILTYGSARNPSLLFVSLAGGNEVLQANPQVLESAVNGIQIHR